MAWRSASMPANGLLVTSTRTDGESIGGFTSGRGRRGRDH
jgi:hypothetical protein